MADLLIRDIDPDLKRRLTEQARRNRRSLSDETKAALERVLRPQVGEPPEYGLGTWLRNLVPPDLKVDLEIPRDTSEREPPDFS